MCVHCKYHWLCLSILHIYQTSMAHNKDVLNLHIVFPKTFVKSLETPCVLLGILYPIRTPPMISNGKMILKGSLYICDSIWLHNRSIFRHFLALTFHHFHLSDSLTHINDLQLLQILHILILI